MTEYKTYERTLITELAPYWTCTVCGGTFKGTLYIADFGRNSFVRACSEECRCVAITQHNLEALNETDA